MLIQEPTENMNLVIQVLHFFYFVYKYINMKLYSVNRNARGISKGNDDYI